MFPWYWKVNFLSNSVVLNIGHADSTQGKNRTMVNMGSFGVLSNVTNASLGSQEFI